MGRKSMLSKKNLRMIVIFISYMTISTLLLQLCYNSEIITDAMLNEWTIGNLKLFNFYMLFALFFMKIIVEVTG